MTSTPNPLEPNQKRARSGWPWVQIAITMVSAVVLGAGSCFGFLASAGAKGNTNTMMGIFATLFVICVIALLGAVVWAVVTMLVQLGRKTRR